jgi:CubicO group peptidase (beta-lactamase class C family)
MQIPKFAEQYLFGPLGIEKAVWLSLRTGWTKTGANMLMRSRDLAKIGLLMLQNGNWNGEQIIPEDWVQLSVQEHVTLESGDSWGSGYGYLWWLNDKRIIGSKVRSFMALGGGGQVIAVFPELNMVIVITGIHYDSDEGKQYEIMERFILPAALGY